MAPSHKDEAARAKRSSSPAPTSKVENAIPEPEKKVQSSAGLGKQRLAMFAILAAAALLVTFMDLHFHSTGSAPHPAIRGAIQTPASAFPVHWAAQRATPGRLAAYAELASDNRVGFGLLAGLMLGIVAVQLDKFEMEESEAEAQQAKVK